MVTPLRFFGPLFGVSPGHFREVVYDEIYHTFPVVERIHTGSSSVTVLEATANYDYRFGVLTSFLDFNEHKIHFKYDPLGRLKSVTKPPDNDHTEQYNYVLGYELSDGRIVNWVDVRSRDGSSGDEFLRSRIFYDGLGRKLMTKQEAEKIRQLNYPGS